MKGGGELNMNNKTRKMLFSALFTGIITVISQIYLPFAVPVTFQIFAVCLSGYVLGAKWGMASVLVYIILGSVGLPVFSGFKGGFGVLFEATGGFIIGFIPLVFLCGISEKMKRKAITITISLVGLLICHLLGVIQFSLVTDADFLVSLLTVSLPYFMKDSILMLVANLISENINKKIR